MTTQGIGSDNLSSNSSSTTSTERGRVYRVNDYEDDLESSSEVEEDDDLFFSSEDLIMKLVDLEKSVSSNEKIINLEDIETETKQINEDDEKIQVEKHVLKFELSKQLFEDENKESEDTDDQSFESTKDKRRRMNEELFAKLFNYDQEQIDAIKSGQRYYM